MKEIILTGVRSNDEPTLGNYIGAFLPMVRLQREKAGDHQINMFVPDLHSFTTPVDHSQLHDRTLKNLRYFVAAGLDVNDPDTYIYRQSYVPAHSELCVILNNFTYMGEMGRMTQYKEKSDGESNVSVGLFDYPVLMAADILLYGAQWVPVGDDQKQHLEITRDIASRLNSKFGDVLTPPHEWQKQFNFMQLDNGVRVRSLSNPEKKMSKSVSDPRGTILLSDDPGDAAKKVMSATTDSVGVINWDWDNQPGITNLLQMLSLLSNQDQQSINSQWTGQTSYGDLKKTVADAVRAFLTDFQSRYASVDENKLTEVLVASEAKMNQVANETLLRVQRVVGLRPRG